VFNVKLDLSESTFYNHINILFNTIMQE